MTSASVCSTTSPPGRGPGRRRRSARRPQRSGRFRCHSLDPGAQVVRDERAVPAEPMVITVRPSVTTRRRRAGWPEHPPGARVERDGGWRRRPPARRPHGRERGRHIGVPQLPPFPASTPIVPWPRPRSSGRQVHHHYPGTLESSPAGPAGTRGATTSPPVSRPRRRSECRWHPAGQREGSVQWQAYVCVGGIQPGEPGGLRPGVEHEADRAERPGGRQLAASCPRAVNVPPGVTTGWGLA